MWSFQYILLSFLQWQWSNPYKIILIPSIMKRPSLILLSFNKSNTQFVYLVLYFIMLFTVSSSTCSVTQCQNCSTSDPNSCSTCKPGYWRAATSCCSNSVHMCTTCWTSVNACDSCPNSYYLSGNSCNSCNILSFCSLCSSSSQCTLCINNTYAINSASLCQLCNQLMNNCTNCIS